jgi:hypothetical protein
MAGLAAANRKAGLAIGEGGEKKMREWVQGFLREKGDPNISPEELERELSLPIFCFRRLANLFRINFSSNIRLIELFGSIISDLPEEVFCQLLAMRNLFFSFTESLAFVQGFDFVEGTPGIFCAFSERLLNLSDTCVRGGIIHELSHIVLGHYSREAQSLSLKSELENQANEKAVSMGFEYEILKINECLKKQKKGEEHDERR